MKFLPNYSQPFVSKYKLDSVIDRFTTLERDVFKVRGWEDEIPPFACKFDESGQRFAVADEDGTITILGSYPSSGPSRRWEAHDNAIFDICWSSDGIKMLTASGDQMCVLWDISSKQKIRTFNGHVGSVKTIDFSPSDPNVFASGSRDGKIIMWDVRAAKPLVLTIPSAHFIGETGKTTPGRRNKPKPDAHKTSVTCVLFQNEHALVSSGSDDGNIKVWDLRRSYATMNKPPIPMHSLRYAGSSLKMGYSHLVFDQSRIVLYANCTDSIVYKFNMSSYNSKPLAEYSGHVNNSFFVKSALSPDENYLLSGSSNNNAYIWKVSEPGLPSWKVKHHTAEVTAVAWNHSDIGNFVTCGDDCRVSVWNVANESVREIDRSGTVERIGRCSTKQASSETPRRRAQSSMLTRTPLSTQGFLDGIPTTPFHSCYDSDAENSCKSGDQVPRRRLTPCSAVLSPSKSENVRQTKSEKVRRNLELGNAKKAKPFSSPTTNLPNFVVDGNSPNVVSGGSQRQKQSRVDWLSRHGRQCKRRKIETSTPKSKSSTTPVRKESQVVSLFKFKAIDSYFKKL